MRSLPNEAERAELEASKLAVEAERTRRRWIPGTWFSTRRPTRISTSYAAVLPGFGLGVFWYAWGQVGFWWALLYGAFWPAWLGWRVAAALALGQ